MPTATPTAVPTVASVLEAVKTLTPEDRVEVLDRLQVLVLADAPPRPAGWPATLHPAWKDEIARRSAEPEDDDVSWEQVQEEMREVIAQADRERDARGEV